MSEEKPSSTDLATAPPPASAPPPAPAIEAAAATSSTDTATALPDNNAAVAPPPASAPPPAPTTDAAAYPTPDPTSLTDTLDLLGLNGEAVSPSPSTSNDAAAAVVAEATGTGDEQTAVSAPPPAPIETAAATSLTETLDLLGLDSEAVSPSNDAAAAVVAEAIAIGGGAQVTGTEAAAIAPAPSAATATATGTAADDSSVKTEESDKTEESESSSSGESGSSSSGDDESSSDEEGSSESSESSEDPSVVGGVKVEEASSSSSSSSENNDRSSPPRSMRKPPPESLGNLSPNSTSFSEDQRASVLTKEQIIAPPLMVNNNGRKVGSHSPRRSSPKLGPLGAPAGAPQASRLYSDDAAALHAAEEGENFYNAYGDVTKLMGEGHAPSDSFDEVDEIRNSAASSGNQRRGSKQAQIMGQDRASVRNMVAHRMKGKGYNRSNRQHRGTATSRRGGRNVRSTTPRARGGSRRAHSSGEAGTGWSNPKRCRIVYGLIAAVIGIVGISLIVYGTTKERAYNRSKDDDYFYNDDLGVIGNGEEEDLEEEPAVESPSEKSPIHSSPTPPAPAWTPLPTPPTPAPAVLPPTPDEPIFSPPNTPPTSVVPVTSTPPPATRVDDALLTLLKKQYVDYLNFHTESSSIIESSQNIWLDYDTNRYEFTVDQSPQWKAYLYLNNSRTDVIDRNDGTLLMGEDHIMQIYSLLVFYETFGWPREGDDECSWPGVTCRAPDNNRRLLLTTDDTDTKKNNERKILYLDMFNRVTALKVKGQDGPSYSGEDGPFGPVLEGELPIELMFLKNLETLDVSHNRIGGMVNGVMIGYWKDLKVLDLNDNRFEGDIPSELGNSFDLQKLTLHHNEFLGEVPDSLCTLREQGNLHFLWVDCSPMETNNDQPKVSCPTDCCTICFEGYDDDGGPSTGGSTPANTSVETPHVVQNDMEDLKTKLEEASGDKGMALMDIGSPQFRAYAWLVEDSADAERLFQRYALATLYFATNGVHWGKSDGWITPGLDECDWFGISGCKDDKIISLDLKGNLLKGSIPPELFEFIPTLVVLNLATNELSGPIPKEIGLLADLDILELAENQLTSIPLEMGNLNNVDHVFLQTNNFGGQEMPENVCELRNSGQLTLLWADCRGGDQATLVCSTMCCTTCFLGDAPPGGGGDNVFQPEGGTGGGDTNTANAVTHADSASEVLAKLKKMAPDGGVSLDDSLSPQYKAYSWLVTADDDVTSDLILFQRYGLATLYFSMAGHGWTAKDSWLSDASVCDWDNVDECVEGMVTELDLHSNNLVGRIPIEIAHVRMIEDLDLTDNELYGPIPTEIGLLDDLEYLRLGGNLLTGSIPSELGNLLNLQELYFQVNEFTETSMPDEICALQTIHSITLWADCQDQAHVYCEDSCCTECFGEDSDFKFYVGYDDETYYPTTASPNTPSQTVVPGRNFPPTASPVAGAPLPENEELKEFLLEHMNAFEDRLSDTNSHAYEAYLWLANSDTSFDTLSSFRKLQRFGLVSFYLSTSPELDWKVNYSWKSSQHECTWFGISCAVNDTVTEISLPSNRLAGTIPPEIALAGVGGRLGKLNLSGNNIGGELPVQIGTLTHLEVLELAYNDFRGKIPSQLGNIAKLKTLQLQSNELTGDMPNEICTLRTGGVLGELVADCDQDDLFDKVTCDTATCCTDCA